MRIINTAEVTPDDIPSQWERDQVYNGLDCCVTSEVLNVLLPQLDNHTSATYKFSKELQGPALEMRLRGVRVDLARKAEVIDEFYEKIETLERNLDRIVFEGVGLPHFNWRSNPDLHTLFYDRKHSRRWKHIRLPSRLSLTCSRCETLRRRLAYSKRR